MDDQPHVEIRLGDCREIIATLPDCSIDSIVTDPPYELGFMGKKWDASGIAYDITLWEQCLRVLKPGGHLLAFGGTRTYHRMTCAIEDAGFEIRDCIVWLYSSGFPKSHNVGKAIDKTNGETDRLHKFTAWMRTTGLTAKQLDDITKTNMGSHYLTAASQPAIPTASIWAAIRPYCNDVPVWVDNLVDRIEAKRKKIGEHKNPASSIYTQSQKLLHRDVAVTAPATDAAKQWDGWGTALKPANEPIVLARKPMQTTVADNVQQHGTGALNIDATRIPGEKGNGTWGGKTTKQGYEGGWNPTTKPNVEMNNAGRWPANVITDGTSDEKWTGYFYVAKASRSERNAGLTALEWKHTDFGGGGKPGAGFNEVTHGKAPAHAPNNHPTVKPLALMRYLVRLITPPGGTVLEPFAGSGTTLMAAVMEGCNAIGCEITDEYIEIIERRVRWARDQHTNQQTTLFGETNG